LSFPVGWVLQNLQRVNKFSYNFAVPNVTILHGSRVVTGGHTDTTVLETNFRNSSLQTHNNINISKRRL